VWVRSRGLRSHLGVAMSRIWTVVAVAAVALTSVVAVPTGGTAAPTSDSYGLVDPSGQINQTECICRRCPWRTLRNRDERRQHKPTGHQSRNGILHCWDG
jgi:hypothetical protein